MNLLLVRHFPTKGNRLKKYIGRTDEPLDDEAERIVINYPYVEAVVITPMLRCRQTAKLLFPENRYLVCDQLRETDFGDFEGKTYEELKENPDYQAWISGGASGKVPNGESRGEFVKRCMDGCHKFIKNLLDQQIESAAFVIHGGTIMAILSELAVEEKDFYDWQIKNGRAFSLELDEQLWKERKRCLFSIEKL